MLRKKEAVKKKGLLLSFYIYYIYIKSINYYIINTIKQKAPAYEVIKAICLIITGREAYPIKADSVNAYQLTLASLADTPKK